MDSATFTAAAVFVDGGVQSPIRDIAGRAGVGLGTVCRHFPTRADLVTAVYRHQLDECAALAPKLLQEPISPTAALIDAGTAAGEIDPDVTAYTLMRAAGNLCILGGYDRIDAKHMVARLLAGYRRTP